MPGKRVFQPHSECNVTKEDLIKLQLNVMNDCPICSQLHVLCSVGLHPSQPTSIVPVAPLPLIQETAYEKFLRLLNTDGKTYFVDEETETFIKLYQSSRLLSIDNSRDAIIFFELMNSYPRFTTRIRFENVENLIIDGNFETSLASAKVDIIRAFGAIDGQAFLLKFGYTVEKETKAFNLLDLSYDEAIQRNIVPMYKVTDNVQRVAIKMPMYICSLETVPHFPEALVYERLLNDIYPALQIFHSKGMFHMDIKPGNILIGHDKKWHICDYGSMFIPNYEYRQSLTTAYVPKDLPNKKGYYLPSANFDFTLMVVTALLIINPKAIDISREFKKIDIHECIDIVVKHVEFRTWLYEILQ